MAFSITSRRYTGSKAKIAEWIMELIKENCKGSSFCDIFAGTGVIASLACNNYEKITINDYLYSNNVIYKAFFDNKPFDYDKLQELADSFNNTKSTQENYFSKNFGDKFFSLQDSLKIGYIREQIEKNKNEYNEKEYNIFLASLLYSADKSANTVGHFDAYIKGNAIKETFVFKLIKPIKTKTKIKIYREDSNKLARKIKSDIIYIDPPYNSRQYSRFYHILENITKWEKPKLYGVALKPEPENMSEYSRSSAPKAFDDLITNLNCKYAVVSYNNTYDSKSSSSCNKIELDFIVETLKKCGNVKQFEKQHRFFNAGKTSFDDHKEYIFIVEVKH
jgi:adenine-specific DNA-methyltransferase